MESGTEKKKLNNELVEFLGQRSSSETEKYAPTLRQYVQLQHKRSRAAHARSNTSHGRPMGPSKKLNSDLKDTAANESGKPTNHKEDEKGSRRGEREKRCVHQRSRSPSSGGASDKCCRRRRKRRRRSRRRRRSCGRRRHRRRRRSCSRRRRRRGCRRRRRRPRRRRRRC